MGKIFQKIFDGFLLICAVAFLIAFDFYTTPSDLEMAQYYLQYVISFSFVPNLSLLDYIAGVSILLGLVSSCILYFGGRSILRAKVDVNLMM